jgi:UDP-N-acetylmuramate dehydrogenase
VYSLSKLKGKINSACIIRENEPMALHTSFKTGGPADLFIIPPDAERLAETAAVLKEENIPVFILGKGANILVSDLGIRGAVIDMQKLDAVSPADNFIITAEAGADVSGLSIAAAEKGLSGLEFIYGMPGSVGGAVWMNARCYDVSVSDVLETVTVLDSSLKLRTDIISRENFDYKHSPYQNKNEIILKASFRLIKGDIKLIMEKTLANKKDRELKGHFLFPSAGSIFKNNRAHGEPAGKIIDKAGLKGKTIGGAKIADYHGNIIINTGSASSAEIKKLIDYTQAEILKRTGLNLEAEVLLAGDWKE